MALEPRPNCERWGIYSATGSNTPVQQMAVNLGAPGDRRNADGTLWLSYPRPGLPGDHAALGFSFIFQADLVDGSRYFRINEEGNSVAETERRWVFASGLRGLKRCVLPLLGEMDEPAKYTATLYLADSDSNSPGNPAFEIRLQGKKLGSAFDNARVIVVRRYDNIGVTGDLAIELVPQPALRPPRRGSFPSYLSSRWRDGKARPLAVFLFCCSSSAVIESRFIMHIGLDTSAAVSKAFRILW